MHCYKVIKSSFRQIIYLELLSHDIRTFSRLSKRSTLHNALKFNASTKRGRRDLFTAGDKQKAQTALLRSTIDFFLLHVVSFGCLVWTESDTWRLFSLSFAGGSFLVFNLNVSLRRSCGMSSIMWHHNELGSCNCPISTLCSSSFKMINSCVLLLWNLINSAEK